MKITRRTIALLLLGSLAAAGLVYVARHEALSPPVPYRLRQVHGMLLPEVEVTVLERETNCSAAQAIRAGQHVIAQVKVYVDDGTAPEKKRNKPPRMFFRTKHIPGVMDFKFIPGVELGLLGACQGDKLKVRMPAELGIPEGSFDVQFARHTPLVALVEVEVYFTPFHDEIASLTRFEDPHIVQVIGGRRATATFDNATVVETATELAAAAAGKAAAVILVHAVWAGRSPFVARVIDKLAGAGGSGSGSDGAQSVAFVAVDATGSEEGDFADRLSAPGLPGILVQRPDGARVPYGGPSTPEAILDFVGKVVSGEVQPPKVAVAEEATAVLSEPTVEAAVDATETAADAKRKVEEAEPAADQELTAEKATDDTAEAEAGSTAAAGMKGAERAAEKLIVTPTVTTADAPTMDEPASSDDGADL